MLYANHYKIENLIIMDGDGEDKPKDIMKMIKESAINQKLIIVAKRSKRDNSLFFKFLHYTYKLIFDS